MGTGRGIALRSNRLFASVSIKRATLIAFGVVGTRFTATISTTSKETTIRSETLTEPSTKYATSTRNLKRPYGLRSMPTDFGGVSPSRRSLSSPIRPRLERQSENGVTPTLTKGFCWLTTSAVGSCGHKDTGEPSAK